MLTSGVQSKSHVDLDFEDDSATRTHILVHDLKPPFLDGRVAYTRQLDPISPIRDPTSDLAVFSRKGSALVRERREQQERAKAAAKMADMQGTTLGNIMGVKEEPQLGAEGQNSTSLTGKGNKEGEEENYKAGSQFASHMKKSEGASTFSRTRTLKEQREYLPAFAVREELMKTIRENQGEFRVSFSKVGPPLDFWLIRDFVSCSHYRRWRNRFRENHPIIPVFI